jgi:hypothetical protein
VGLKPWYLNGLVVDAQDEPIPGAFVNFAYTVIIDGDTLATPLDVASAAPEEEADSVRVDVFDHGGRMIWTDVFVPANQAFWDGSTFSGRPAPDGPTATSKGYSRVVTRTIED